MRRRCIGGRRSNTVDIIGAFQYSDATGNIVTIPVEEDIQVIVFDAADSTWCDTHTLGRELANVAPIQRFLAPNPEGFEGPVNTLARFG